MSWLFAFTPEELTAIRLSLQVAFWAMLGSLPVGVAIALVLAAGAGGYALWRFVQAGYGTGPEGGGDSSAMGRIVALGSGIAYLAMCGLAISVRLRHALS